MSVTVTDSTGVLTPAAKADLEAGQSPFRVKVLFESTTKPELQAHVHTCVDTANTLCIGVDPGHRFTWTEIGVDTGIKSGDYQQVGRAGNADFKAGQWSDGVKAIMSRGAVLSQRSADHTAVVVQQPTTIVTRHTPVWPIVLGFGILVLIVWALVRKLRRDMETVKGELQEERAEYLHRNVAAMTAPEPAAAPRPANFVPDRRPPPVRYAAAPPALPTRPIRPPTPPEALVSAPYMPVYVPAPAPVPIVIVERERTPAPAPSYSSSPSPSYDSGSSSSSSSSFDSFSGGGGGGDFGGSSGGGGGGDF